MFPKQVQNTLIAAALVALAAPAQQAAANDFPSMNAISRDALKLPRECDVHAARRARSADNADELRAELFSMTEDNFDLARMCELMQAGADPNALDEEREFRPLHLAIEAGSANAVYYLLSIGADPNLRDREGRTALDWAIKFARQDPGAYDSHKALLRLSGAQCNVNC